MLICSKIPYDSRRDALIALRAISRAYARRGLHGPQGAYLCTRADAGTSPPRRASRLPRG